MKIGIDCRLINKIQNTGISRYTEFLIEYYVERYGEKNVILITNDSFFNYNKCEIKYTHLRPFNLIHFLWFSKYIEALHLDLFHVPFYASFFRKNKTQVIVTVHDLMYKFVGGFFGKNKIVNYLKIKYFDFIVKKSLLNADKIVSVSKTTKRDVFDIFCCDSFHIPEDSGIECNDDFTVLEKNNLKEKGFYFYCGNNRPHKNLNFVIEIFKNNPQLPPLVLAGKGHSNSDNVITTGIVSEEELKTLYKTAIAFIFPSKYEGFGLPILESLKLKTLVVASKIPAFLEFKSDNIFYFEIGNETEFLSAIKNTLSSKFVNDKTFFDYYSKKEIYKLNDDMIKDLLF